MHSLGSKPTVQDRLDYLSMVCANPSDGLSAGVWCEAANEGLMLARSLVEQLEAVTRERDEERRRAIMAENQLILLRRKRS